MDDIFINKLSERVARLEERQLSSEKALELARKDMDSRWINIGAIASVFISLIALILQFFKR